MYYFNTSYDKRNYLSAGNFKVGLWPVDVI